MNRRKGQNHQKTWLFRPRLLAILIILVILIILMVLRPSNIRKKHLRIYGAEIGHVVPKNSYPISLELCLDIVVFKKFI